MKAIHLISLIIALSLSSIVEVTYALTSLDELKAANEVATCIDCHSDNGQHWTSSLHAQSLADPEILASFRSFMRKNVKGLSRTHDMERLATCLECHAPQATGASTALLQQISERITTAVESPDAQKRLQAMEDIKALDVNCRVCHMLKGMPPEKRKPGTIYGPGWDEDEQSHTREYGFDTKGSDHLLSSAICVSCHMTGPDETFSSSYLEFHSHALKHYREVQHNGTCQDCHMRENGTTSHKFEHKEH